MATKQKELENRAMYLINCYCIKCISVDDFIGAYCPELIIRKEGIYKEVVKDVIRNIYVAPNDKAIRQKAFELACSRMNERDDEWLVAQTKEDAIKLVLVCLQDAIRHKDFIDGIYRFNDDVAKLGLWTDRLQEALKLDGKKSDTKFEIQASGREISQEKIDEIQKLRKEGRKTGEIAKIAGVSKSTAYKYSKGM